MKLLLTENVKHLGHVGDIVEVKNGYGRNFLLPQGLATSVTTSNVQAMEAEKNRRQAVEDSKIGEYKTLAERIAATDITLHERTSDGEHLYGSVSARELAAALAAQGIEIDDEKILIAESIKTVGVHHVKIRLHRDVTADLKAWVVARKEDGYDDDDDDEPVAAPEADDDDAAGDAEESSDVTEDEAAQA